jgi:16S rRNA (guanine527-N7)-methyltransferase
MSLAQALEQRLSQGLEQMGLVLSAKQQQQLLAYLQLLMRWNQAFNLTAIRDPLQMVSHHLLDSLSLIPHLDEEGTLLDVGTGAGLPGIPLAIARPGLAVSLLDSNGKKVRFLRQVQLELGLELTPYQARLETWLGEAPFRIITARAFTDLENLVAQTLPHLEESGKILAMKGTEASIETELQALPQNPSVTTLALNIPYLEEKARHLVMIQRVTT